MHFLASPSFSWCRTSDGGSESSVAILLVSSWDKIVLIFVSRSRTENSGRTSDSVHRQSGLHARCATETGFYNQTRRVSEPRQV